jgi:hypothetical protein
MQVKEKQNERLRKGIGDRAEAHPHPTARDALEIPEKVGEVHLGACCFLHNADFSFLSDVLFPDLLMIVHIFC